MIAIALRQHIDHFARLAKAQARLRAAETPTALDQAIAAMDIACAASISNPVLTAADAALRNRAQEWASNRPRLVVTAHQAIVDRAKYRVRRVSADRNYMRKSAGEAR